MSELTKRVLFAVVAIPVVGALIWIGGLPLALLLSTAAALGAWEYSRLSAASNAPVLMRPMVALAAAFPLVVHAARVGYTVPSLPVVALIVPFLLTVALLRHGIAGKPVESVASTIFGSVYTGGMLAFAYALRHSRLTITDLAGTVLVGLPLVLTWLNDIGAYTFGRWLGRVKLMPTVSPGKTIAGAVGGLLTTVVACWLYVSFILRPYASLGLSLAGIVVLGVAMSLAAQVGDLAESMMKRQAGVKDSSALIPGHGGVLDRVDALLFTLPLGYVLLEFMLTVRA